MFNRCFNLTKFTGNLNSLKNGTAMFGGTGLTEFNSGLPSLQNGEDMFRYCYLDKKSVYRIIYKLPKVSGKAILTLGIAEGALSEREINRIKDDLAYIGWEVEIQENSMPPAL